MRLLVVLPLLLIALNRNTVHCGEQRDPSTPSKDESNHRNRRQQPEWLTTTRRHLQNILHRIPIFKNWNANDEPEPRVVDGFLTEDEATLLLQRYEPLLRESLHFAGGGVVDSKYRTSHSVRLPPLGDDLVFDIEERAAKLAGMPHSQVEDFQLACYGVDELYGLHRDDNSDPIKRADRSATVLIYLQAPTSGGATLFTRRSLEDERDLDTKQRLTTEKGALKLFRKYCAQPRKKFVVVDPVVGRAVTWPNWHGANHSVFCHKSTHGACPVIQGKKCVIQQWIARTTPTPLREPRVAAIFAAGADQSFRQRNHTVWFNNSDEREKETCLVDASTNRGRYVARLCLMDTYAKPQWIDASNGPYNGVGGMRLSGGGLTGSVPVALLARDGITVSFWARNVRVGTVLLELSDMLSIVVVEKVPEDKDGPITTLLQMIRPGNDDLSSPADSNILGLASSNDWFWFSLQVDMTISAKLDVFSRSGELIGSAMLPSDGRACTSLDMESQVPLRMLVPARNEAATAFVGNTPTTATFVDTSNVVADVSFILIHKAVIENTAGLRGEIGRYNIDL